MIIQRTQASGFSRGEDVTGYRRVLGHGVAVLVTVVMVVAVAACSTQVSPTRSTSRGTTRGHPNGTSQTTTPPSKSNTPLSKQSAAQKKIESTVQSALVNVLSGNSLNADIVFFPLMPENQVHPNSHSTILVPVPIAAIAGNGSYNLKNGEGQATLRIVAPSSTSSTGSSGASTGSPTPSTGSSSPTTGSSGTSSSTQKISADFVPGEILFLMPPSARSNMQGRSWIGIPVAKLGGSQQVAPPSLLSFALPMDVPFLLSTIKYTVQGLHNSGPPPGTGTSTPSSSTGAASSTSLPPSISWYTGSLDLASAITKFPVSERPLAEVLSGLAGDHPLSLYVALDSHTGALRDVVLMVVPPSAASGKSSASSKSSNSKSSGVIPEEIDIAMLPSTTPAVVSLPPSSQVLYLGQSTSPKLP